MKKEADYLLENDLAVPSCSPWSSPCLLAPKADGTPRFCTDYRKVNAVTDCQTRFHCLAWRTVLIVLGQPYLLQSSIC